MKNQLPFPPFLNLFEVWKEKAVEVIVEMGAQQAPVTEIASRLVQMAYSSSRSVEESPFAQAAAAHGALVIRGWVFLVFFLFSCSDVGGGSWV